MEEKVDVILRIVSLPITFYEIGNKSFYDLLKETGYFECSYEILEDNIATVLLDNQELVDKWFEWSENKRSYGGWYLLLNDNGKYEVGRIGHTGKKEQFLEYSNKRDACATFIKREIEEVVR